MKKTFAILASITLALCFASACSAQVTPVTTASASAINWQGNWYAATDMKEQIPIYYAGASKNSVFSVGSKQLLVPGEFNAYLAMASFQPDLTPLLGKTPISPDQLQASFDLSGGVSTFAAGNPQPTINGAMNVAYNFSASNSLTTGFVEGGFIGTQKFWGISAGWQHVFNATNAVGESNRPSASIKRLVLKARQLQMMKATMTR